MDRLIRALEFVLTLVALILTGWAVIIGVALALSILLTPVWLAWWFIWH